MNLTKLFEKQRELDAHILLEKGLVGHDLLDKKILALQVELGELANEWRGFKFWSNDQEPRDWYPNEKDICESCKGEPIFIENGKIVGQCKNCDGCGVHFHNPLLEEYVDCLHFILSIGLDIGVNKYRKVHYIPENNITDSFLTVFEYTADLNISRSEYDYLFLFNKFIELGSMLGFTWKQIEQAYLDKNKINHERQESGY